MDDMMMVKRDGLRALVQAAAEGYVMRLMFPPGADREDDGAALRELAQLLVEAVDAVSPGRVVRFGPEVAVGEMMHPFGQQEG